MGGIKSSILEKIGETPLVRINKLNRQGKAEVLAKVEFFNPGGSVKDRVGLAMIEAAEANGTLESGGLIIEPTSGNTGIGLSAVAASRGYKIIIVMPASMSMERRILMKAYGAELVLTDSAKGMSGAIEEAERLHSEIPDSIIAGQFTNMINPETHYKSTGPEIWNDTDGTVDYFVAGVGTGGTLSGVGKYLKEMNPNIKIIAVEPSSSPVLSGGKKGSHGLQGIGAGFIPKTLDTSIYDSVICVNEQEAYTASLEIAQSEGYLVGISSGAALHAAELIASDPANSGKNIVVLLPDTGERYLSSDLFKTLKE